VNDVRTVEPVFLRTRRMIPRKGAFVMSVVIICFGFYVLYPIILIAIQSFNVADKLLDPPQWGLKNWKTAFQDPQLLQSLLNTGLIFGSVTAIGFPIAVFIAWALARVRMPFSHGLELLFWMAYMVPTLSMTMGWIFLADPTVGLLNKAIRELFVLDSSEGPFNIFSITGIVWVHLMTRGISDKVMLLTPAFRNMDVTLEEAARISGASNIMTMMRVTLPVMLPPMVVVFALHITRTFESFEIERLLGVPFGFFVYSTKIFELVREQEPPAYGEATALASITLLVVALIIPLQRWLIQRRLYTTVTGSYKPGLVDIGRWRLVVFSFIVVILMLMLLAPLVSLILGSVMFRAGIFSLTPTFGLDHWRIVLSDQLFLNSLMNTVWLASTTALISPILFSLVAYLIVRTKWPGRNLLDSLIWISTALPGMLSGLGLLWMFTGTPFLLPLYGTLVPLLIVVVLQGKTTGTQMLKAVFVQMGSDMEEQARVSGAGWLRAFFLIWLPIITPTLVLIGTLNFVMAATTTSSIILLATRGTQTLSILALELADPAVGMREAAGVVSLIIMMLSMAAALAARRVGYRIGLRGK
jgi:iron(III) transport system permease protein